MAANIESKKLNTDFVELEMHPQATGIVRGNLPPYAPPVGAAGPAPVTAAPQFSNLHFSLLPKSILDRFGWMTEKRKVLLRAALGEGLCTFLFIFIVCATHVNHVLSQSVDSLVLGAISTGFASVALIYSFADVSGAHFNPAVTFATIVAKKTSFTKGALYVGVQLFASIFATLIVAGVFPTAADGTRTMNDLYVDYGSDSNAGKAFVMEFFLTFILVYVIFATAFDTVDTGNKVQVDAGIDEFGQSVPRERAARNLTIYTTSGNTKAGFAPIAIGLTLGFLCLVGGTVSGGAFNPARVFGPALVGNYWTHHWVYWFGDFLGAACAAFAQSFFAHHPVQESGGPRPTDAGAIAPGPVAAAAYPV